MGVQHRGSVCACPAGGLAHQSSVPLPGGGSAFFKACVAPLQHMHPECRFSIMQMHN